MRLWVKIGLFLSSYLPFFLILAIKNWLDYRLLVLFAIVFAYSLVWAILFLVLKKDTTDTFKITKIENRSHDSLTYLVPYIISFMNFDLSKWNDCASLLVLLVLIFYIYINSNLLYVNPILHVFGYRFYRVEACDCVDAEEKHKFEINLISNYNAIRGEKINVKKIESDNDVFLGVDK